MFEPPESIELKDLTDSLLARFNVTLAEYERVYRHNIARMRGRKSLIAVHVALDLAESFGVESALTLHEDLIETPVGNVAQSATHSPDPRDVSTEVAPVHMAFRGYAACKTAEMDDVVTRTFKNVTCTDCEDRFLKASPVHWAKGAHDTACGFTVGEITIAASKVTCPSCVSVDNKRFLDSHLALRLDEKEL